MHIYIDHNAKTKLQTKQKQKIGAHVIMWVYHEKTVRSKGVCVCVNKAIGSYGSYIFLFFSGKSSKMGRGRLNLFLQKEEYLIQKFPSFRVPEKHHI